MILLQIDTHCQHGDAKWFFWILFLVLGVLLAWLASKSELIKEPVIDKGVIKSKYSFARSQSAWWLLIIVCSFATVYYCKESVPVPNNTVLWLLGISSGTLVSSGFVNYINTNRGLNHPMTIQGKRKWIWDFLREILSDENGISIYRLQAVLFNFLYGIIFINETLKQICDGIIAFPEFGEPVRTLLVISGGAFVLMKGTEYK